MGASAVPSTYSCSGVLRNSQLDSLSAVCLFPAAAHQLSPIPGLPVATWSPLPNSPTAWLIWPALVEQPTSQLPCKQLQPLLVPPQHSAPPTSLALQLARPALLALSLPSSECFWPCSLLCCPSKYSTPCCIHDGSS